MPEFAVGSNNFLLTKCGFKRIDEVSKRDEVLGLTLTHGFEWDNVAVSSDENEEGTVRLLITDKNEITLDVNSRVKVIRDDKSTFLEASDVLLNDFLELVFPPQVLTYENVKALFQSDELDQKRAYLLGVLNNVVEGLNSRLTLKIWGEPEEIHRYGTILTDLFSEFDETTSEEFVVEEGARYGWLIFSLSKENIRDTLCKHFEDVTLGHIFLDVIDIINGIVPLPIRLAEEGIIKEYITGLLDVSIEFDYAWNAFKIALPITKNEVRRFLYNYLNLKKVQSIMTKVLSPHFPWETHTFLDLDETIRKCDLKSRRPLMKLARSVNQTGDFISQVTLLPRIRANILKKETLSRIVFKSSWKPLIEWTTLY